MPTMRSPHILMALLLALPLAAAQAEDLITSVKVKQVEVFDIPDDAKPGQKVEVSGLPWTIKEEKNSFYKVALGGKDVWIDSMQVMVARDATSNCAPKVAVRANRLPDTNAGTPGAAATRCR